jgi:hypothetical protein
VQQQGLLPTPNDPKLWLVHVRPNHERELCMQILQKSFTFEDSGKPLMIKSAVCLDHLKVRAWAGQLGARLLGAEQLVLLVQASDAAALGLLPCDIDPHALP